MSIKLDKYAIKCEENALAEGRLTPASSPKAACYEISRAWRELDKAPGFTDCSHTKGWSEHERLAAEVLIATLTYLQRIRCRNIELLLKESVMRHSLMTFPF